MRKRGNKKSRQNRKTNMSTVASRYPYRIPVGGDPPQTSLTARKNVDLRWRLTSTGQDTITIANLREVITDQVFGSTPPNGIYTVIKEVRVWGAGSLQGDEIVLVDEQSGFTFADSGTATSRPAVGYAQPIANQFVHAPNSTGSVFRVWSPIGTEVDLVVHAEVWTLPFIDDLVPTVPAFNFGLQES